MYIQDVHQNRTKSAQLYFLFRVNKKAPKIYAFTIHTIKKIGNKGIMLYPVQAKNLFGNMNIGICMSLAEKCAKYIHGACMP